MTAARTLALCLFLASPLVTNAVEARKSMRSQALSMGSANPIRKVVNMLQNMQKKVIAEGEAEKELFEKFMCYCKTSGTELADSIAKAEDKLETLPSEIEEAKDNLKAKKESLKKAQTDRASAKQAMAEATGIREKEAKAYASTKAEAEANLGAIKKAVAALEAGMKGGAFLQTGFALKLKQLVRAVDWQTIQDDDKIAVDNFLQGKTEYAPQSGAITGILKQMGDEMQKSFEEATAQEEGAIKDFEGLISAKTKEVSVLTKAIEKKIKEIGDLGVEVVQMSADLDDTEKGLAEDKKFLKDLEKGCGTKSAEWEKTCEMRQQELVALGDTIKILNDDDALELFKKTLPAPSASFMQLQVTSEAMKARALDMIRKARNGKHGPGRKSMELDLIAITLSGRKVDFSKVIGMIDDMVALLKKEQVDDDDKKAYCEQEFDTADDKKKALEKEEKDATAAINNAKKGIEVTAGEIKALVKSIADTDAAVKEATAQRKAENSEFKELVASNTAAKELLKFAKNRLNKFYNPKLYKPPAKKELSAEGRIADSFSLSQVDATQPAAPGPFKKKTEESTGVIAMIDLLIADIDKEVTTAEAEEKNAQGDYEAFVDDSAAKRTEETKTLADKEKVKADLEAEFEEMSSLKKDIVKELYATMKYIDSLHRDCDFLLDFYTVRKEARNTEIKAMTDAKAVLSGADYSLIETGVRHHFLSRH